MIEMKNQPADRVKVGPSEANPREPELNDKNENALIDIFLHLEAGGDDTPEHVMRAVDEVAMWAQQRHHTWGVKVGRTRWKLKGIPEFVLGVSSAILFFLPEIMGHTCAWGVSP